ncbi:zinc finger MYM-type protein 1-like [Zea mays]|uniref:zinc finger MYM-type protein 1-like n=1 Tax=Zea mays TaxID=4577 RepID=UPI0009AA764B|nr:zinc finger MYM-type protein 1-like [Zea mays]|eukprot:XP_020396600.1 zinc finger MYM-type protein 1-like [Zea mays]
MERFLKRKLPQPANVNLDELAYDPADRKRITEYPGLKLQEEIRRRYLVRGPHRPQPGFKYPQTIIAKKPRRFNPEWFEQYDWLEYSEKVDKAFCLYCYLFRDCIEGQAGNDAFVTKGFFGWNNKKRLDTHVGGIGSYHNEAVKRCNNLLNPNQSIEFALKKQQDIAKEEYFIRLSTSINAVRYLLHQGLAFRGHDESEESDNKGNFLELVKLLAEQNEKIKRVVLKNAPDNHQMVAPCIQKDITNCFSEIIVSSIIEEIGGDVFCLLVDESADVSDKEQMAVVLRYVDKHGVLKERLIGVVHVTETTASCLKSNIDALFSKYKLSWKQVRGQGYDGASNMRGEFNGLRALIMRENGSSYYVHCFAHQLQLVIVAVAKKNDDISDFFDMISLLLNVAGASCKRKDMIRQSQQERVEKAIGSGQISTGTGLNQEQSLQRPGDTRWCSHYKTLKSLNSLFPSVVEVLEYVEKDGPNDKKKRQARGLLDYLKDFDFVFHLHLMLMILGHANSLSLCLQRKDQDILEAMSEVKLTKQKIQQIRDDGWECLLERIYSFCEEHGIPKLEMEEQYIDRHKPRSKTNRTNYQHYRWDCLNSVLDLLLIEFNDRFGETNSNLLTYMAALSPKNCFGDFKVESLMELAKLYPDDFSSDELKDLAHDLPIYIDNIQADERFSNLNTITELAKEMVDKNKHLAFPLVYRLLKLVLVLPVATASVERCFSAMKIVKTILRNRIGNTFMNDCIVCFVEPAYLATISDNVVIDRFQKMENRNRKMLL